MFYYLEDVINGGAFDKYFWVSGFERELRVEVGWSFGFRFLRVVGEENMVVSLDDDVFFILILDEGGSVFLVFFNSLG